MAANERLDSRQRQAAFRPGDLREFRCDVHAHPGTGNRAIHSLVDPAVDVSKETLPENLMDSQ